MKAFLRQIRLFLGKIILDKKVTGQIIPPNPKIIVLQQDGKIGDYIVSSFIFRELKRQYPQSQIDVLCSPNNHNLFAHNAFIDHCYLVERKKAFSYSKIGLKLRKNQYDVCINLPVLIRNRDLWLTRLIQAKNNIGYLKQHYALFNLNISDPKLHFSQVYRQAIELCGVTQIQPDYEIPDQCQQKSDIAQFITQHQLDNCIAVNFFGAANSRKFNPSQMYHLLTQLNNIAPHKTILLLTYPAVNAQLTQLAKSFSNVFIYTKTETIFDTIELLNYAQWVISPDTSIIHIAAGLNKKIVAFYKTSDEENMCQWHPNSQNECHIIGFSNNINEINVQQLDAAWFN